MGNREARPAIFYLGIVLLLAYMTVSASAQCVNTEDRSLPAAAVAIDALSWFLNAEVSRSETPKLIPSSVWTLNKNWTHINLPPVISAICHEKSPFHVLERIFVSEDPTKVKAV